MKTCYVIESGWILIGDKVATGDETIRLNNASVVRRWDNGLGIGGIAKAEHKDEYTLDHIGNVEIFKTKVLFVILCEW